MAVLGVMVVAVVLLLRPGRSNPFPTLSATGTITAKQLIKEYSDTLKDNAATRYRGKKLLLKGQITEVRMGYLGTIDFEVKRQGEHFGRVRCEFADEKKGQLAKVVKGQSVVVRGFFKYHSFDGVYLSFNDCELVEGSDIQGDLAVETLLEEFIGKIREVDGKYRDKDLRVSGVIKKIDFRWDGTPTVDLLAETDSDDHVVCRFNLKDKKLIVQPQQGDEIKLKGLCKGCSNSWVTIENCELLSYPDRVRAEGTPKFDKDEGRPIVVVRSVVDNAAQRSGYDQARRKISDEERSASSVAGEIRFAEDE